MNDRLLGIVIRELDVKDNDKIIQIYTKEHGRISLYGRGLKKSSSKNAHACQLFDLSEFSFDYLETKDIQLLKSASLKNEYYRIKSDYEKLILASMVIELIGCLDDDNLFDSLKATLDLLESTQQPYTVFSLFMVSILKIMGIAPEADCCVVCGDTQNIETVSVNDGGFLCRSCNIQRRYPKMELEFLRKFRIINKADYKVLDKILDLDLNNYELTKLLTEFLTAHSGINLKSWRNLQNFHEST